MVIPQSCRPGSHAGAAAERGGGGGGLMSPPCAPMQQALVQKDAPDGVMGKLRPRC